MHQKLRTNTIKPNENISFPIGTILAVDYFYESLDFSTVFGKHEKNGIDSNKYNFSINKAHKWIKQEFDSKRCSSNRAQKRSRGKNHSFAQERDGNKTITSMVGC